jgi:isopentenyldiphosphate isomerase
MERWDEYTVDRVRTGRLLHRGQPLLENQLHLVVHACVFNQDGEMLIQQRHSQKDGWPNLWDITAGGSALAGESSQTAMARELFEELGIKLDLQGIRPHLTVNFEFGFDDYYLLHHDLLIESLTLQEGEVQQVKWASLDEIKRLLASGDFIPYHPQLIELLFGMRKGYGAIQRPGE